MKKRLLIGLLVFSCLLALSGCGHTHTWIAATCTTPKTCSSCGETEGEALGHSWREATCIDAKTCTVCRATEGEPLGHLWDAATCEKPKTCSVCGITEGTALGHSWAAATCAKPKTCTICGKTEGKAPGHAWSLATCTEPKTCSVCGATKGIALGHNAPDLTCTNAATCIRCNVLVEAPGHLFTQATCTKPATCTVCGETEGEALGHTTESGVCSRCGLESYPIVSGSGDDVVSDISVGDHAYRVHFTHTGWRNFIVKAYDAKNDRSTLINEIGPYDGSVLLRGSGPYSFEITADGSWTYVIEQIGRDTAAITTHLTGTGDCVTDSLKLESGAWLFTHDGSSNFIVRIYTTDGRDSVVNEIGAYSGKKMLTIPSKSFGLFEIKADGAWTISKVQ